MNKLKHGDIVVLIDVAPIDRGGNVLALYDDDKDDDNLIVFPAAPFSTPSIVVNRDKLRKATAHEVHRWNSLIESF